MICARAATGSSSDRTLSCARWAIHPDFLDRFGLIWTHVLYLRSYSLLSSGGSSSCSSMGTHWSCFWLRLTEALFPSRISHLGSHETRLRLGLPCPIHCTRVHIAQIVPHSHRIKAAVSLKLGGNDEEIALRTSRARRGLPVPSLQLLWVCTSRQAASHSLYR